LSTFDHLGKVQRKLTKMISVPLIFHWKSTLKVDYAGYEVQRHPIVVPG
jgi:hypothetical protein